MAGAVVAFWVAGCATERLDAAAPSGVNLTGNWKLNLNLSDDPDKLGPDPDKSAPQHEPGSHRGHGGGGRGGGGGMPPMGSPGSPDGPGSYELGPTSSNYGNGPAAGEFLRVGLDQSESVPPTGGTAPAATGAKPSRGASINRLLRAPLTMSITQDKATVTVKTAMPDGTQTTDEYTAGTKTTIPFGKDETAERTAGWRGPVFVVTTAAKKFGTREDDFGIDDDDGRLIVTTQTKGGRLGKVEIKRVYDRVRAVQP